MCNAAVGSLEVTHRQDAHIAAEEAEVCRALEGTIGAMVPPQPRLPDTHLADAQQSVESHGPDSIARHSQRIAISAGASWLDQQVDTSTNYSGIVLLVFLAFLDPATHPQDLQMSVLQCTFKDRQQPPVDSPNHGVCIVGKLRVRLLSPKGTYGPSRQQYKELVSHLSWGLHLLPNAHIMEVLPPIYGP